MKTMQIWYSFHPEGTTCKQYDGYREYPFHPELDEDGIDNLLDMVYELRSDRRYQMSYHVISPDDSFTGVMATMLSDFQPTYSEFGKLIAD